MYLLTVDNSNFEPTKLERLADTMSDLGWKPETVNQVCDLLISNDLKRIVLVSDFSIVSIERIVDTVECLEWPESELME